MSYPEFLEWVAFAKVEPIGYQRSDLHFGALSALIANVNRDSKRQSKPFEPIQFIADFWEANKPKAADLLKKFMDISNRHNNGQNH